MANSDNEVNSERENSFSDSCVESMVVDSTPLTGDKDDKLDFMSSDGQKTEEVIQLDSLLESINLDRLEHRAQRFGTELSPAVKPISEAQLKGLCKSLDLDYSELFGSKGGVGLSKVRLDAIHVRGVDNMNTEDVFDYFKDCGAVSIEWVNDHSCNVVWLDTTGPARALISLSQPMKRLRPTANKEEGGRGGDDEQEVDVDEDNKVEDVEMDQSSPDHIRHRSSSSLDSDSQQRRSSDQANTSAPHNSPAEAGEIEEDVVEVDAAAVDVPIPPGSWRLGVPHPPRTKFLLLRYANRTDRKIQGAEKLSQYYLKNGNPNYKGLKGIISTSLKRKIKDVHRKPSGYVDLDAVDDDDDSAKDIEPLYDFDTKPVEQLKRPRMRMYADDEEEKTKGGSATVTVSSRESRDLRNRIGNEKLSVSLSTNRDTSESSDLRLRLGSRQTSQQPQWNSEDISRDLSKPSVIGDLRSKLEKLRQSRQPKGPLLIEISQDDV